MHCWSSLGAILHPHYWLSCSGRSDGASGRFYRVWVNCRSILLLPFMFGMEPMLGLALMIGLIAVVPTSDTFASVLMGIPGSQPLATVLDGSL